MSSSSSHRMQYAHNRDLLKADALTATTTKHPDWVVTIAFYSVLHLVEAKLSELGNRHSENHRERSLLVAKAREFRPISIDYETLRNQCWNARYSCKPLKNIDAKDALILLERIEKAIH